MSKSKIAAVFLLTLLSVAAFAQTRKTVRGTVIEEETGESLPGATVQIVGSTKGVSTDLDGAFELSGVKPTDKLKFEFFGKEPQTITVGDQVEFTVRLKNAVNELEDAGVTVGCLNLMKGLEFDAVAVVWPMNVERTPDEGRRLYTACSRALHSLALLAGGGTLKRLGL